MTEFIYIYICLCFTMIVFLIIFSLCPLSLIGAAFAAATMLCSERSMKMPANVCISFISFVYLRRCYEFPLTRWFEVGRPYHIVMQTACTVMWRNLRHVMVTLYGGIRMHGLSSMCHISLRAKYLKVLKSFKWKCLEVSSREVQSVWEFNRCFNDVIIHYIIHQPMQPTPHAVVIHSASGIGARCQHSQTN